MKRRLIMIRKAKIDDISALLEIYNENILNGTASFEEKALIFDEGKEWLTEHQGEYPLIVFEEEDELLGFASLSPYGRQRETAYCCAEISIYVSTMAQGQGVGSRLMDAIIEEGKQSPKIKQLISVITDGNQGSIHLHEKKGFSYGGRLENIAEKQGKMLSMVFYQKECT
jgi:phosphinothricin acetyltransferase